VADATTNKEMPMVARYSILGVLYWIKVVQDTASNLATGITAVYYLNDVIYAFGGVENDDQSIVIY
jgi:hypothetical protein